MTTREPSTWIKQPAAVFTANELDAGGGVVVRGDRIVELVGRGTEPDTPPDNIFDASGKVLLPGLVNGHHHFYQTLTRAHGPGKPMTTIPRTAVRLCIRAYQRFLSPLLPQGRRPTPVPRWEKRPSPFARCWPVVRQVPTPVRVLLA